MNLQTSYDISLVDAERGHLIKKEVLAPSRWGAPLSSPTRGTGPGTEIHSRSAPLFARGTLGIDTPYNEALTLLVKARSAQRAAY